MPNRYQLRRKMPDGIRCRSVGRPTKFGNPFSVKTYGLAAAVKLHGAWLETDIEKQIGSYRITGKQQAELARRELRGRHIACHCSPNSLCHGDTLLRIANE